MELQPGTRVDRYVVEATLGKGGMAVVYRVRHGLLGHAAALKILLVPSPAIRARLLQEGRVQSNLRHPNVVAVSDVVDVGGAPGLVMEYIDGPPLDRYLEGRRLTLAQADVLARGILRGVVAAHAAGTIHRDLKPGNILLAIQDGEIVPKITDFGLAKAVEGDGGGGHVTRTGLAMGTPAYMAPEQIRSAKSVDGRADVFSLGCILYELVTGVRAFPGDDIIDLFGKIGAGNWRPTTELVPDLPDRMAAAIAGALVPDADRRIRSAAALYDAWTGEATGAARSRTSAGPWDEAALAAATSMGSGPDVVAVVADVAPATMASSLGEEPRSQETMDPGADLAVASFPEARLPPPAAPKPARRGGGWGGAWLALTALLVSGAVLGAGGLGAAGVGALWLAADGAPAPTLDESAAAPPAAPAREVAQAPAATPPAAEPATSPPPSPAARADRRAADPRPPADAEPPASAPGVAPAEPAEPAGPVAEPSPAPVATGTVVVRHCPTRICATQRAQDRSVLRSEGRELAVGVVPVGRYELWTTIGNAPPKRTQTLVIEAGRTIRVLCLSLEARCVIE